MGGALLPAALHIIATIGNVCIFTSQTTHTIVDVDAAFP
jgi:hypothetical protein